MKKLLIASLSLTLLGLSSIARSETSYVYAPVIDSQPVYRIVEVSTPQEQCWEEQVAVERRYNSRGSQTPVLISTLIGGAIGNAVGHRKSNQRVGAVVGAVLGHSIGRDIINRNEPRVQEYQTVQRCDTVYQQREEERLSGYQVTYLYDGQEYTVRTNSDPGEQIRIRVSFEPVL